MDNKIPNENNNNMLNPIIIYFKIVLLDPICI